MTKSFCLLSSICLCLFLTVACQSQNFDNELATKQKNLPVSYSSNVLNITLIQHDSCPWSYFWCVVEKGINDAAKDLKVNVKLLRPSETPYKPSEQKELIEKALKDNPDGIGVTLTDRKLFREPLTTFLEDHQDDRKSRIPVIAYNAGNSPDKDDIPYDIYIGQDEEKAGYEAGKKLVELARLKSSGKRGVCINHQEDTENLQARCRGFENALRDEGIPYFTIITKDNPKNIKEEIEKDYQTHKNTDIVLSLGQIGAAPFYEFMEDNKLESSQIFHATFDLSKTIINNIENGRTLFAIDQQPYLQGYMVVQWLALIKNHNFTPPGKVISTGPSFVDKDNLDKVKQQVGQYR
ncbi:hypothetical protein BC008_20340 [Mastigocoleus testarum BC008]|uniref:Periplasmic binding protein domain-containing protein n=2 Tax=Mastigocoleus TaxID=996924 RepID=A0A0V7ZL82_9CYAN|nr:hypothetical protein BC008_20340 [Mastigocoleus testarum BC008]